MIPPADKRICPASFVFLSANHNSLCVRNTACSSKQQGRQEDARQESTRCYPPANFCSCYGF